MIDMNYVDTSTTGYTLAPGIYESNDINLMLKSLIPDEAKANATNDDIRLTMNLTTNKTNIFTRKNLFSTQFWGLIKHIQAVEVILKDSIDWMQDHRKAIDPLTTSVLVKFI